MPSDSLLLEISPALLEAMDISGEAGKIDYFQLLGVRREKPSTGEIDGAVMRRSKELRPWQNSPQHGEETVELLPLLHRVAAILKDPPRYEAYHQQLERLLSGEEEDPVEVFSDMVRAALADGVIDQESKAELLRFARQAEIPMAEAGRIVNEIAAVSRPAAPSKDEDWEFRLAGGDPATFRANLDMMLVAGRLTPEAAEKMLSESGNYELDQASAIKILQEARLVYFRNLIKNVAGKGVITNNQARLLKPKAESIGLQWDQAYDLISEFMFTGATADDLRNLNLTTTGFDDTEIHSLLEGEAATHYVRKRKGLGRLFGGGAPRARTRSGASKMPRLALRGAVALLIAAGGFMAFQALNRGGSDRVQVSPATQTNNPSTSTSPSGPRPTPQATDSPPTRTNPSEPVVPTPASPPRASFWDTPPPELPSGMVVIGARNDGDPPRFEIKRTEVTCREYKQFLTETFHPNTPDGWESGYNYPRNHAEYPVHGVSWADALEFCQWKAGKLGIPIDHLRPPTQAEFARVLSAPVSGELHVPDEGFWNKARLTLNRLAPATLSPNDILLFPSGWVYDALANVAEWGMDEHEGQRIILGGDHEQKDPNFDPRAVRYRDPNAHSSTIGFRYVIVGAEAQMFDLK